MKILETAAIVVGLVSLAFVGCVSQAESHEEIHGESESHAETHGEAHGESGHPQHKIIVTSPVVKDVVSTQQYVCQIHSCKHIEVRALEGGYLDEIGINEGQAVKKGERMFKILPTLYQAKLDSESAELQRISIELQNAEKLNAKGIVSPQEIMLKKAELAKAQANMELAKAELNFTDVKAPFDGIVDRQYCQLGSLIEEGDILTTLSDNNLMWVYFNVSEARYLEYKQELDKSKGDSQDQLTIELKLANGAIFPQQGEIGAIEADFNNTTGNIEFRADFANPSGLLRNGQTGTILIHRTMKDVFVIPQRATYEILDKRYAFVVDEQNVVHQRDIAVESEQDDIFVLKEGLAPGEKIVFEGIRQVRDGDKIAFEYRAPEEILNHLKYPAE
ncbi:efflux RND transporter periplasmic adaptor subunit [Blastopirellula retiformator]|uniref:Efflux pump periplasmic linker BepF n=1 Tax=Blastopirellula retiformator TaxID=2527970 RepID=A0A5C5VK37_9BACT|nr:efflux RND transporter periplasmic adaptor subunit [Blastopirellula retiformator]TWT38984.1 Efflux pump periplasmic linker BepF [Blastopirellula retiformator]